MPTRKVLLPTQPSLKTGSGDAKRSSKTSIFLCFFDANTRYISYTADIVAERRSCCSRFFVKSSLPRLIPRTVVASTGQVNSLVEQAEFYQFYARAFLFYRRGWFLLGDTCVDSIIQSVRGWLYRGEDTRLGRRSERRSGNTSCPRSELEGCTSSFGADEVRRGCR